MNDVHVRMALRLQAEFGLRREEAMKFTPSYADRGDRLAVKGSTAKGGRPREVPVLRERPLARDTAMVFSGRPGIGPPLEGARVRGRGSELRKCAQLANMTVPERWDAKP